MQHAATASCESLRGSNAGRACRPFRRDPRFVDRVLDPSIEAAETVGGFTVADLDCDGRPDVALSIPESRAVLLEVEVVEPADCAGDCDGDGFVTVDELVLAVRLALGDGVGRCTSLYVDREPRITIDEIVAAVKNAVDGCPIPDAVRVRRLHASGVALSASKTS